MLSARTRWKQPAIAEENVRALEKSLGISKLVAQLLAGRGITDPDTAQWFLNPEQALFHDPLLMSGMKEAVLRIRTAIEMDQKIRIYGDYDCDGVSSTAILYLLLERLGANFDFYIPDRFSEGYGLNMKAVQKAKDEEVDLIITVDTGITAKQEIQFGQELGMDFIVTDHHQPPAQLPTCLALINPHLDHCPYPFKELSGAGIAFKLAQALLDQIPLEWADLAAIGTIADLVPLTGENRLIAYHGLKAMNQTIHLGLQALLRICGLSDQVITEEEIGYLLGPRINASGRLEKADHALHLLTSRNEKEAEELAVHLDQLNGRRQELVNQMTVEAKAWIEQNYPQQLPKAIVVAGKSWHTGVIGIVASRLVETYYRPTIVLSIDEQLGLAKGSARSIVGFDMYQALRQMDSYLSHYGGHPMAAGLTMATEHLVDLRRMMDQLAEQWLTEEDFQPLTFIDMNCSMDEISIKTVDELQRLAPYGSGHPKPIVLVTEADIQSMRQVGSEKQHLKALFGQNEAQLEAIGFGWGELTDQVSKEAKVNLVGHLSINEWNGSRKPQIVLKDVSIEQRQYFDWRGRKESQIITELRRHPQMKICIFRQETKADAFFGERSLLRFDQAGKLVDEEDEIKADSFLFFDLPQSKEQMIQACHYLKSGKHFFLLMHHDQSHFFSVLPDRNQFKSYYAFLQKLGSLDLNRHAAQLSRKQGWSVEMIQFMTKVFLDLQFVTIEAGIVRLVNQPLKRELDQSPTYRQKQEERELEQEFIYSSCQDLIQFFETVFAQAYSPKEEKAYGF